MHAVYRDCILTASVVAQSEFSRLVANKFLNRPSAGRILSSADAPFLSQKINQSINQSTNQSINQSCHLPLPSHQLSMSCIVQLLHSGDPRLKTGW